MGQVWAGPVKSKVEISQNFVAFSEYMNFTRGCTEATKWVLLKKGKLEQNIWSDETMAGLLMRLCLLVGLAQPKNMRHRVFTFLKGPWEIIIRFYN